VASIIQYWAAVSLGPVVLVLVLGLTTGPLFKDTTRSLEHWPWLGSFVFHLLPFVVLSLAFGLFYQLIPNTRVQPQAALVGGIVGGTLWQLNNKLSVLYVSKAVSYSQIYGSISIIPLFLIGMYFSWLILLFGAQVAYAFQNRQSYLQERQAEGVNQRGREFVALRMMTLLAQHFQRGDKPPGVNLIATTLGVPSRLISQLVQPLVCAKLIVEVADREISYTPARPLDQITAHDIIVALRAGQGMELETRDDGSRERVREKFDSIYESERETARAVTLEMLANGEPPASVLDKVRLA
jgi:membrane protein